MQPHANIIQLRQLLAERFPHLRTSLPETSPAPRAGYPTGLPHLDQLLQGGLPKGAITELTSLHGTGGANLILFHLLQQACETRRWIALIDGQDCFDPAPLEGAVLSRLLWVRCQDAQQALKATDLLLRDGNLALVLLDFQINPVPQLRKIPATTWYRLQRLIEPTSTALLVITPQALVGNALTRLSIQSRFTLESLTQTRQELLARLEIRLDQKRGLSAEPAAMAEVG